ncbi:hypothetical protein MT962_000604 [Franconibacter sp. IITDAS19]|uniref:hypothetical protein n=1 Tax=Franconibacter sp. IITDAS19 TaxID=2930569 RepID=UPI001FF723EB|nr:hypothetical protein [Franconibacter sp. IITDAS19]MCK1966818.1 hypothetical protein [Franconibacter sp. IITDAS19]
MKESRQPDYRAIVERIAVILHGKVTDIDLLSVTVQAMKERNSRLESQHEKQPAPVDMLTAAFRTAPPAPSDSQGRKRESMVVPDEMPKGLAGQIVSLLAHNIGDKLLAQKIRNVCRAAMLTSKETK